MCGLCVRNACLLQTLVTLGVCMVFLQTALARAAYSFDGLRLCSRVESFSRATPLPFPSTLPQAAGIYRSLSSHKLMSPKLSAHFCSIHAKYEQSNVLGSVVQCRLVFRNTGSISNRGRVKKYFSF